MCFIRNVGYIRGHKMNKRLLKIISFFLFVSMVFNLGCAQKQVKRFGMVILLKPEKIEEYKKLHADDNPGVRDLLNKYNMHNFSIFLTEIEGKWYEFGYYEYTGSNYESDMAELAAEQRNIEWLKVCNPMQIPLKGSQGWKMMEQVYYNE